MPIDQTLLADLISKNKQSILDRLKQGQSLYGRPDEVPLSDDQIGEEATRSAIASLEEQEKQKAREEEMSRLARQVSGQPEPSPKFPLLAQIGSGGTNIEPKSPWVDAGAGLGSDNIPAPRTPISNESSVPSKVPSVIGEKLQSVISQPSESYKRPAVDLSDKELEEAQAGQKNLLGKAALFAGLDRAIQSSTGIDQGIEGKQKQWKEIAGLPVEQILQKRKAAADKVDLQTKTLDLQSDTEKADPTSPISKVFRESLKEAGYNVPDNISAHVLDKNFNNLLQVKSIQESIKARIQSMEESRQARRERQDELNEIKLKDRVQRFKENTERSKSFTDAKKALDALPDLQTALKDAYLRGGQSTAQLGAQMAKMLEGGGKLTDKDVRFYVQNPSIKESILSGGKKAITGKITQTDYNNLNRLIQAYEQNARNIQSEAYKKSAKQLSRLEPDIDYRKALYYYGIDEETPKSESSNEFEPDVLNYAKTHNISPEQAQSIKNKRMGR